MEVYLYIAKRFDTTEDKYYKAPTDLRIEILETLLLTSGEWGCSLDNDLKLCDVKPILSGWVKYLLHFVGKW